jgi:hypothetical protein
METIITNLIKLYASHSTEELDKPDAGPIFGQYLKKTPQELIADGVFKNGLDTIRGYKKYLEGVEKTAIDARAVMTACLKFILAASATEGAYDCNKFSTKMEIFKTLALEMYDQKWSQNQKDYFNQVYKIFTTYNFYFLSYTNHYSKRLNDWYDKIFKEMFAGEQIREEDLIKNNLLARAFVKQLQKRNLKKGFFDNYSLRKSELNEAILSQAKRSISMIQLISVGSLEYTEPNWSFDEYNAYETEMMDKSRIFFFTIEEQAVPQVVHPTYESWRGRISNTNQYPTFYNNTTPEDFYRTIDNLIDNILKVNLDLANAVPGD